MARYASAVKSASNTKAGGKKVVNHQGGTSFTLSAKEQLATFLLSQFMTGGFYETQNDQHARLVEMISNVDPVFAAKAAIYARDKFGMRTVTHVVGARLPQLVKGQPWMKNAISSMIVRPDDAVEMMAYHKSVITGPIPNALKKGVALGLRRFDGFQLDKWNKGGKFNLVDTVNLVTGGKKGRYRGNVISETANGLVQGKLETAETWETKLSQAGQSEDKDAAKAEAWQEMVMSGKIGHMALLMNLRNILETADTLSEAKGRELVNKVFELLSNEKRVVNSRVFPFRYITTLDEISKMTLKNLRNRNVVVDGLNAALDISVMQVIPKFDGKTLIAVDDSGSMTGATVGGDRSVRRMVSDVAAQLAAFVYKSNPDSEVIYFAYNARSGKYVNPSDSTTTVVQGIRKEIGRGGGTYFNQIFDWMGDKFYDRVIILSDMQGADSVQREIDNYRRNVNPDVFIHSLDLAGYGTSMFAPNNNVAKYAGFSEKVFTLMAQAEEDPKALVNEIEAVEINF